MAKAKLAEPLHSLEGEIIRTLTEGLKTYRPDLQYPQSYSDMQSAVRGLLKNFSVCRRDSPIELPSEYD